MAIWVFFKICFLNQYPEFSTNSQVIFLIYIFFALCLIQNCQKVSETLNLRPTLDYTYYYVLHNGEDRQDCQTIADAHQFQQLSTAWKLAS